MNKCNLITFLINLKGEESCVNFCFGENIFKNFTKTSYRLYICKIMEKLCAKYQIHGSKEIIDSFNINL